MARLPVARAVASFSATRARAATREARATRRTGRRSVTSADLSPGGDAMEKV
jgi:hypothetical protein